VLVFANVETVPTDWRMWVSFCCVASGWG